MHYLSLVWYFAPGWGFLTTFDECMLSHAWEIDQKFCSLVKSPPLARTALGHKESEWPVNKVVIEQGAAKVEVKKSNSELPDHFIIFMTSEQ